MPVLGATEKCFLLLCTTEQSRTRQVRRLIRTSIAVWNSSHFTCSLCIGEAVLPAAGFEMGSRAT